MNGAEAFVATLEALGVDVLFGLCGDTTLPLYEALHDRQDRIRHVLTRDERSASFMADAYARFSGRVGVCEGPSGGGATYILPGVAEANGSSVPLVCVTSDIAREDHGRGTLTELDQEGLFRPITRKTFSPPSPAGIPRTLRQAFRTAVSGALGATHMSFPFDVQTGDASAAEIFGGPEESRYPRFRTAPDPESVERGVRVLDESKSPLIVAGAGVLRSGAWAELTELAHRLSAPVATSIGGKGAIAETDPLALGVIGSNGGLPYRHDVVRHSDVIFYVGCGQGSVTTEKWTLPEKGASRILQLDVDPTRIGRSYEIEVALVADAKHGLSALLDALKPADKVDPQEMAAARDRHLESIDAFTSDETPIRPERFLSELLPRLPEDAVLVVDPGTGCPYFSAYYRISRAGRFFVSPRAHGGLGYALPGVCGAYFARPDAGRIVGVMGDGSFGIACGELETLVRLELPVTLIVFNNQSYGWIKAGQRARGGKYFGVDFSDSNHAAIGGAFGMASQRVESPNELGPAIEESLKSRGPYLLDIVTQPLHEAKAPVSKWIA